MKKKFIKGVVAGLSLLVATGLASCDNSADVDVDAEPTIEEVVLVANSVPASIKTDEILSKIGEIQLRVYMSDGTIELVNVTKEMIGESVLNELAAVKEDGTKVVTVKYLTYEYKVNLSLDAPETTLPFKYNLAGAQAAMKNDGVVPTENYKMFLWFWGDGVDGQWTELTETEGNATGTVAIGTNGGVLVYTTTEATEGVWSGDEFIAQTIDLDVSYDTDGYVAYASESVTCDLTTIAANLQGADTTMPTEDYDLYIWTWGGTISAFAPVDKETGVFKAPVGTNGGCFVLMPKGERPSWNAKYCQTNNYAISSGVCTPQA